MIPTLLLPLLQSALRDAPIPGEVLAALRALDEKGWAALLETAEQQTVTGLLYLAAGKFPEDLPLPENFYWELMKRVNILSNRSRRMAALEGEILSMLAAAGLHPLVMKGSTCAARYPAPELRTAGDIDLYLPEGEFLQAEEALRAAGYAGDASPDGSIVTSIKGVTVELHERYFDWHAPADAFPPVPSPEAELVMLSAHILKHACGVGVGLRQICDFALAWQQYPGDRDALEQRFERLGLGKWNRLLLSFLQRYLDPSVSVRPVDPQPLLRIVLHGGNFGHYADGRQGSLSRSPLLRKADTARRLLARLPFALRYAPREAPALLRGLVKGNLH